MTAENYSLGIRETSPARSACSRLRPPKQAVLILICALWLAGCGGPPSGMDSIAIVGAVLENGAESIQHSIVIVRDGKIAAAGQQALTPIPKTAEIVDATGRYLVYGKAPARVSELERFEPGKPADLLLLVADPRADAGNLAKVDRRMAGGQWIQ